MKICPTCGEVYPDRSTTCRAHNTVLLEWADATDTHSTVPTAVDDDDDDAGHLFDTEQMSRVGEFTQPELRIDAAATPSTNIKIDASLFADTPRPTRVVGDRYRLGETIGIGGYGAVFDAYDERLDKRVAVKILSPALTQDSEVVTRFQREAIAASRVRHECIVDVTDFDVDPGGTSFIVMEYLDGCDLSDVIDDDGALEPARALTIAAQCASALSAAHASGILHRDLKPANIFLVNSPSRTDFVKIIDFGISKITNQDGHYSNVTSASKVVGTPFYMPPEQARGQQLDGRTDVYALGIILFEMLTDERPFIGSSAFEILTNAMTKPRVAPSSKRPELAAIDGLDELVLGAISVKRERRFESMEAFGDAIMRCLSKLDKTLTLGLPSIAPASVTSGPVRIQETSPRSDDTTILDPTDIDPTKPTTLEASSGEITAPHATTRSKWLVPALSSALALAAIMVFLVTRTGDTPADEETPEAHPASRTVTEPSRPPPPIVAEPDLEPDVQADVEPDVELEADADESELELGLDDIDDDPEQPEFTVRVTSSPSGAVVSRTGHGRLGVTPLDVTLSVDEDTAELSLRRAGRTDRTLTIDRNSDESTHVALAALAAKKPTRTKKPKRAKKPTKTKKPKKPSKPSVGIKDW